MAQIDFEAYADSPEIDFEAYADKPPAGHRLAPDAAFEAPPDMLAAVPETSIADRGESLGRGLAYGATLGAAPYISAIADFGSDATLAERIERQRQEYAMARARAPVEGAIGDFIGSMAPGVIFSPFGRMAAGAGKAGLALGAAADGALGNVMRGGIERGGLDEQSGMDATLGAAGGALGSLAGPALNRAWQYGKQAIGSVPQGLRDLTELAAEKFGATNIAKKIANPSAALGGQSLASTPVDGLLSQEIGDMSAAAAVSNPEVKDKLVQAITSTIGNASDKSQAATIAMVNDALESAAESGSSVGVALRTIYKHTPANASKRVVTAVDAFQPLVTDMDPRAIALRNQAAALRAEYEAGLLNKGFGKSQDPNTFHAVDIGYANRPGYATADDIWANRFELDSAAPFDRNVLPAQSVESNAMAATGTDGFVPPPSGPTLMPAPQAPSPLPSSPGIATAQPQALSPQSLDAAKKTNREIGRAALKKIATVAGAVGGAMGGGDSVAGIGAGMAGGAATGLLGGQVLDVAAVLGSGIRDSGRQALTPAALSSSFAENPSALFALRGVPGSVGKLAGDALQAMQSSGGEALKARSFILSMDPEFRRLFATQPGDAQ